MIENPYKRLPPIERRPENSLYRMTTAQRKQANARLRRECCNCGVIDEEEVTLHMVNPKAPCFIRDENETFIYLILPVNFNAAAN